MNVDEKRKINAINVLCDFSLGTLWWVANKLWRTRIKNFDSKHPHGKHPGLSLGKSNFTSPYQTIPMLLGSHANKNGFPVAGLSADDTECTLFKIKPYSFFVMKVFGDEPDIVLNSFKSKLTGCEKESLKKYLQERGVAFDE